MSDKPEFTSSDTHRTDQAPDAHEKHPESDVHDPSNNQTSNSTDSVQAIATSPTTQAAQPEPATSRAPPVVATAVVQPATESAKQRPSEVAKPAQSITGSSVKTGSVASRVQALNARSYVDNQGPTVNKSPGKAHLSTTKSSMRTSLHQPVAPESHADASGEDTPPPIALHGHRLTADFAVPAAHSTLFPGAHRGGAQGQWRAPSRDMTKLYSHRKVMPSSIIIAEHARQVSAFNKDSKHAADKTGPWAAVAKRTEQDVYREDVCQDCLEAEALKLKAAGQVVSTPTKPAWAEALPKRNKPVDGDKLAASSNGPSSVKFVDLAPAANPEHAASVLSSSSPLGKSQTLSPSLCMPEARPSAPMTGYSSIQSSSNRSTNLPTPPTSPPKPESSNIESHGFSFDMQNQMTEPLQRDIIDQINKLENVIEYQQEKLNHLSLSILLELSRMPADMSSDLGNIQAEPVLPLDRSSRRRRRPPRGRIPTLLPKLRNTYEDMGELIRLCELEADSWRPADMSSTTFSRPQQQTQPSHATSSMSGEAASSAHSDTPVTGAEAIKEQDARARGVSLWHTPIEAPKPLRVATELGKPIEGASDVDYESSMPAAGSSPGLDDGEDREAEHRAGEHPQPENHST